MKAEKALKTWKYTADHSDASGLFKNSKTIENSAISDKTLTCGFGDSTIEIFHLFLPACGPIPEFWKFSFREIVAENFVH